VFETITPEHSAVLDAIIKARHSVRAFSSSLPSREALEAIIQAGLFAPFPALAVAGKPDFRKVFVIRNSSTTMETAAGLIKNRMAKLADEFAEKVGPVPFVKNLKRIAQQEKGCPRWPHNR
jgi:nitroreductase